MSQIDSLSYFDPEPSVDVKKQIEKLISIEKLSIAKEPNFAIENYLSDFPIPNAVTTELLHSEYQRIKSGNKLQYKWDSTPQAQYEHASNKYLNVQVGSKHLSDSYQMHNETMADIVKHLNFVKSELTDEINSINRKRKQDQMTAGQELDVLNKKHTDLVQRNIQIQKAITEIK
jgi:pre-mRNA-splicing factor SPF27